MGTILWDPCWHLKYIVTRLPRQLVVPLELLGLEAPHNAWFEWLDPARQMVFSMNRHVQNVMKLREVVTNQHQFRSKAKILAFMRLIEIKNNEGNLWKSECNVSRVCKKEARAIQIVI